MFNMENTSRIISAARKEKNMTQMELADKLNISFQAVSNWERGLSMPDISKLPEIAELLEISIDEVLGKSAPLINGLISGTVDTYLKDNNVTPEEVIDAAPILKPEQIDKIFENCKPPFDLSQIEDVIPFLGNEVCDELFKKCCNCDDMDHAMDIAPFVDKNLINQTIAQRINENKSIDDLVAFASRDVIDKLVWELFEQKGILTLDDFLPFISKSLLNKIANVEYENRGLHNFECIAPFMDKQYLNSLAKKSIEKDGIKAISPIAPFLDKNILREFVKEHYL